MNSLKAVFWDLDGTIADTELCGHRVAFNLAFRDFGLNWNWDEKKYLSLLEISGGLNRIIHYRNETKCELSNSICSQIQKRKRLHYKNLIQSGKINVRHGVKRLITEIANFDIKQIIVTTSGRESVEPFLQTSLHSHLNFFSEIITYDDVNKHKPFPDAYELAIKLSKHSPLNSIAIEDSNIGVKSAKAANLNILLTLPPWSSSSNNITNNANSCVDTLGDFEINSKLIYGNPLITNYVDLAYLKSIIN